MSRLNLARRAPPSRTSTPAPAAEGVAPSIDELRKRPVSELTTAELVEAWESSDNEHATPALAPLPPLSEFVDTLRADWRRRAQRSPTGEACPCCGVVAVPVRWMLKPGTIPWLLCLVEAHAAKMARDSSTHDDTWIAVGDLVVSSRDYAHLALFVTEGVGGEALIIKGRGRGMWQPSRSAAAFLANKVRVPQSVYTLNGDVFHTSPEMRTCAQVQAGVTFIEEVEA